jgi:hypothetical protein
VAHVDRPAGGGEDRRMPSDTTLGADYARALAAKDFARIGELLHPQVNFRALTPRRNWEADDAGTAIADILRQWFDDGDEIRGLEHLECDAFADRERVGYRFSVHNADGDFLVEQQAYLEPRDGRIGWMRVVCSGFRPVAGGPGGQTGSLGSGG